MSARLDPEQPNGDSETELDFTDGGWDPYIASLLMGDHEVQAGEQSVDEEDTAPVMSFSRRPAAPQ